MINRHPYITATIVATLLAIVVWLCMPKHFTAVTKVSDEYKEMDLVIGLNDMKARLKDVLNNGNSGINDMGVYCKLLKTDDFARSIARKQLAGKRMDYGHWVMQHRHIWQTTDTIEAIQDHINYNFNSLQETLIIAFTDRDADVAAEMLDNVTAHLQDILTNYRHTLATKLLENAKERQRDNQEKYEKAQHNYDIFFDTHYNPKNKADQQHLKFLEKEVRLAYQELKKSTEECVRQMALSQRESPAFSTIQATTTPTAPDKRMIEYIACFVFMALLLTKGAILYRQKKLSGKLKFELGGLTSPWTLTVAVWGGMLFLLLFRNPTLLNAPKDQFYISLILWLFFFCTTSFLTYNLLDRRQPAENDEEEFSRLNLYAYYFLLFLSIVMTPLYVKKIYDVVLMFGTEDFMNNVRNFAVSGDLDVGYLSYSVPINIALMLVSLWRYPKVKMWQLVWACSACILNSLAIMEKGEIFTVFFCVLFVLYERKHIKLRSIAVIFLFILLFFFAFNLMRAEEDSEYQREETIWGFIAMYILSPPVAFGEITQDVVHQFAARTVPTAYYILNKHVADIYIVYDRLQPFVSVPVTTNVYTIFQPFFQDFGYMGVAGGGLIYGLMCGILYRKSCNGNFFSKCLYTYFAYILVLQFFQENLFTIGLFIPELMLFTYMCTQRTFSISQQVRHDRQIIK